MKKILLFLCLAVCLSACGKADPDPTLSSTADTVATDPTTKTVYVHSSIRQESSVAVSRAEYIFDENNFVSEVIQYSNDVETLRYTVECDKNGNFSKWICGEMVIEYAYDEQGHSLGSDYYQNGELMSSTEYIWDGDLRTGTIATSPQQNLENRSQITYDENGNMLRQDLFVNGELSSYSICTTDEQGRLTGTTAYLPDGTAGASTTYTYEGSTETRITAQADGTVTQKTVITYDDHGNILSAVVYDGEGTVISTETHTWKAIQVPLDCPRASV